MNEGPALFHYAVALSLNQVLRIVLVYIVLMLSIFLIKSLLNVKIAYLMHSEPEARYGLLWLQLMIIFYNPLPSIC